MAKTPTNGNDAIVGTPGNDIIDALLGNDTVRGNAGNDKLSGSGGNDSLNGGDGNGALLGGEGNDTLLGRGGNDLLDGGNGNGNDSLQGDSGNDLLTGGSGSDQFLFGRFSTDLTFGSASVDAITDFTVGTDKFLLSKAQFTTLQSPDLGGLLASEFGVVNSDSQAGVSSAKIVYNLANGKVFYNSDGAIGGFSAGGQFATLNGAPANLSNTDFSIEGS